MVILHTKHLKKYYGEEPNVIRAVDDVDLSVNMGEFVAIIGTSGSGKSTLLHILGTVDKTHIRESGHRRNRPCRTEPDGGGDFSGAERWDWCISFTTWFPPLRCGKISVCGWNPRSL